MLVEPMTQLGQRLVASAPTLSTVAGLPENDAVTGAIGLYRESERAQLPSDHHKILAVMLANLVYGFQRVFELESERREDRLITIGRTVSGILHDLRTPISVIGGFAQIMAKSEASDERTELAEGIRDQLGRIKKMTEDVLAFARGDITVLPEKVYLSAFVKDLEQSCNTAYAEHGVRFQFDCQDRGMARFDEHKMNRVVLNLCRNAAQAMPKGGLCRVLIERCGAELHLQVSDQGVGIPEHMRARIFDAFESHGKEGGTGLGLSMARRIVEAHGGRIEIDSIEGKGTDVHMFIPAEFSAEDHVASTQREEVASK
jgi:signal transduction histidine kinase